MNNKLKILLLSLLLAFFFIFLLLKDLINKKGEIIEIKRDSVVQEWQKPEHESINI